MWKYLTKENLKEFILSLDLVNRDYSDNKKLNILYTISNNPEKFYTTKYINKKDGTKRELLEPKTILKSIQKKILNNVLYGLNVSKYACAYIPSKKIAENTRPHTNKKIILKLDIKDFFTNITFENIYNILPNSIFPKEIKVLLVKLCTYYDYLPQGSPTSPYISNLVLKSFDKYIGKYCEAKNISYTRYCDDLTFSGDFNIKKLKNKVQAYIEEMGFNLNEKKTKVIRNNRRQTVTGVVVNKKTNVTKEYKRKIRQEMYYIKKYGLENSCKYINKNPKKYLNSLKGKINYCLELNYTEELRSYLKILKEYQQI